MCGRTRGTCPRWEGVQHRGAYPRLEPVDKLDNVRMLELLEHLELVVDHLLVTLDISLQDNLDGHLARGAVSLTNNAICSSTESSTESILGPIRKDCLLGSAVSGSGPGSGLGGSEGG